LPPPHPMRPKRITKFMSLQIDRSERHGLSRPLRSSTEPFSSSPSATTWEQLDEASRIAALEAAAVIFLISV